MGFKIWRKDNSGWCLAFDIVFDTKEKADDQIAELNAQYAERIRMGELSFYSYRDDIKLAKDGSVIDPMLPMNRFNSKRFNTNNKGTSRNVREKVKRSK